MRTRPSFTSFPIPVQASDFAKSRTKSPFGSVHTLAARSPLPIGIESFSFCPKAVQVTSSAEICESSAARTEERQKQANQATTNNHFGSFIKSSSHGRSRDWLTIVEVALSAMSDP